MSAPKITDQPDNPFVIFNIECNIQWKIYCTVLGYCCEKKICLFLTESESSPEYWLSSSKTEEETQ